jgi:hypothetical protein
MIASSDLRPNDGSSHSQRETGQSWPGGTRYRRAARLCDGRDEHLAWMMSEARVQLEATGDPNRGTLPVQPAYDPENGRYRLRGATGSTGAELIN